MAASSKKSSPSNTQQHGKQVIAHLLRNFSDTEKPQYSGERKSPARPLLPCDARPDLLRLELPDLGVVIQLPDNCNHAAVLGATVRQLQQMSDGVRHV